MVDKFDITLINGECIKQDKNIYFGLLSNDKFIGSCRDMFSFLSYYKDATSVCILSVYGNVNSIQRVIPKASILSFECENSAYYTGGM